jgi:hypothetical protein
MIPDLGWPGCREKGWKGGFWNGGGLMDFHWIGDEDGREQTPGNFSRRIRSRVRWSRPLSWR